MLIDKGSLQVSHAILTKLNHDDTVNNYECVCCKNGILILFVMRVTMTHDCIRYIIVTLDVLLQIFALPES